MEIKCSSFLIVKQPSGLISYDNSAAVEDDMRSQAGNEGVRQKLTKEQLFEMLYSKDYSKVPASARFRVLQ